MSTWSKAKPNGYGNFRTERNDRGAHESIHGPNVKGGRVVGDHVHFHKDGITITKNGQKTTVRRSGQ